MPASTQDNTPSGKVYVPPKAWDELTDSEKIERMREIIHQQGSTIAHNNQDTHWLKNLFFKHDHDPRDGKLIIQPETHRNSGGLLSAGQSTTRGDKPYF